MHAATTVHPAVKRLPVAYRRGLHQPLLGQRATEQALPDRLSLQTITTHLNLSRVPHLLHEHATGRLPRLDRARATSTAPTTPSQLPSRCTCLLKDPRTTYPRCNRHVLVLCFSAAMAAVGSVSYHLLSSCAGSIGAPLCGAARGPAALVSPSPERRRIGFVPPPHPNVSEILPWLLFRLELMWRCLPQSPLTV
jgi:hypothetical protein